MRNIDISTLLETAESFSKDGVNWHHHFMTPKCAMNTSGKFRIILENEDDGNSVYSDFKERPMADLENLENLFFKRRK